MFDDNNLYGTATGLNERGRHKTMASALDAAFADLTTEHNDFFDSLVDNWRTLYPNSVARPGRYEDGKIFLYVGSAPALYSFRMKLGAVRRRLALLPGAPKKIDLRLEIHAR